MSTTKDTELRRRKTDRWYALASWRPGESLLLWKLVTVLALVCALVSISRNTGRVDKVCTTVQRQMDRNAATLKRSLDSQVQISMAPQRAVKLGLPGAAYYSEHPGELAASMKRTTEELHIYQQQAC